jgi:RNA polymerase sigma-70 factor (ECF subfamily)
VNLPFAPSSDQEFLELLVKARQGDQRALGTLIDRYRPYLMKIAYEQADPDLRAKEGGSDLVQDTYLKAVGGFQLFTGRTANDMRAWLRRILLNRINYRRVYYHADRRSVEAEIPLHALEGNGKHHDNLDADISSPSENVVCAEERQILDTALQALPEMDRDIITLRQKFGCAFGEIARRLSLTKEVAQKRWVRAIQALQEKVKHLNERFPR